VLGQPTPDVADLLSWSWLELRWRCGKARRLIGSETHLSCV